MSGDDGRRRRVPRLRGRHRGQLDRPQPPEGRRGDRRAGGRFIHAQANVFTHDLLEPLAATLAEIAPGGIDTFFFANSGAEITEAAVKLAKQATGRPNVIVFAGSFHGRTHLTMAMTTSKTVLPRRPRPAAVGRVRRPVPRPAGRRPGRRGRAARSPALDHLLATMTAPAETAAMIIEPVLGEGGYVPAPAAFLDGLVERCRDARHPVRRRRGAERVRPHGRDVRRRALGIEPDVICMAKGIASGFPFVRARHPARARRPVADGQPRRHVRRQPDRVRGRAGDDRRADRTRVPRRTSARAASSCARAARAAAPHDAGIRQVRGLGLMVATEFDDPARVAGDRAALPRTRAS